MTIRSQLCRGSILAAAALLCGSARSEPQTLTVAWRDKPPYHYTEADVGRGFLLERARQIFKTAEIPARFVGEPQKRIWAKFAHGATNYCSISWYKLSQREALAQYSMPIHEDLPHTILVAPGSVAQVTSHATLAGLLADPELTLGVVDGVSYGPELDRLIKDSKNRIMGRTVDTTLMIRMLGADRASYMFADREDWEHYRRQGGGALPVQYDLPAMPPGLRRHIVCSKDVPQATMDKLNKAIAATGGMANPGHGVKQK